MISTIESYVGFGRLVLARKRLLTATGRKVMIPRSLALGTSNDGARRGCRRTQTSVDLDATVEARAIIIIAFADDFTTTHNDTAMTIMQSRERSLLEAEGQVSIVPRHGVI